MPLAPWMSTLIPSLFNYSLSFTAQIYPWIFAPRPTEKMQGGKIPTIKMSSLESRQKCAQMSCLNSLKQPTVDYHVSPDHTRASRSHDLFFFFAALRVPRWAHFTRPVTLPTLPHSGLPQQINGTAWGQVFNWAVLKGGDVLMRPGPVFILNFEALPCRCPSSNLKAMYRPARLPWEGSGLTELLCRAWHFHLNPIRQLYKC